jgi:DNA polymerase I-like protein with 3'-5' exonuclease and polymerase domains
MLIQKKYTTVDSQETLKALIEHIRTYELLTLDIETDSLNPRKGQVIGFSICGKEGESFYMPTMAYQNSKLEELTISGRGCHELALKVLNLLIGKKIVCHNAAFDLRFIKNYYKLDLIPHLHADTMLLVHTVNEEGAFGMGSAFGLKPIAKLIQQHIGLDVEGDANEEQIELKESIKRNGGSTTKDNYEIYKADLDVLAKYGAADTDLTLRIYNHFIVKLEEEQLEKFFFEEEVMPIYREVTIPMEEYGVELDLELIKDTKEKIEIDLAEHARLVMEELLKETKVKQWVIDMATKAYPPSAKGTYAQELIEQAGIELPRSEKTGKFTLNKATVLTLPEGELKQFLLTGDVKLLPAEQVLKVSLKLWKEDNEGKFFNIQSKDQLGQIAFNVLGRKPLSTTASGKPQFDDDVIEQIAKTEKWAENIRIYNKLLKIKSTYVDRFHDNHEDGRYYFYFKQHGTVSGRYGSDLQQLPKPKEDGEAAPIIVHYNNLVRAFLVAEEGRMLIDCDYESLEPHCFASVTGDEKLQEIFNNNHDFYSTVAIQTEKLEGVSPDKKAPNFLKKVDPVKRNQAKAYSLGIAYGMESFALAKTLDIPQKEADILVQGYLDGFPGLKAWRENSRQFVKEHGYIKNKVGRIRHLPKVKSIFSKMGDGLLDWRVRKDLEKTYGREKVLQVYRDYKNGLNNCLNYQLQSLAAAVVNRAAVEINRELRRMGIDGRVQAQVHDQLIINVPEEHAEEVAKMVKDKMENTTKLDGVTLKAPPALSKNFRDGH